MSKQKSALRIMEALSSVDQDLLERCDISEVKEKKSATGKVTRMSVFWIRTAAACLALIAVGALSWNGLRSLNRNSTGGSSYDGAVALDQTTGNAAPRSQENSGENLAGEEYEEEVNIETGNDSDVEKMVREESKEIIDGTGAAQELQSSESSNANRSDSGTCVDSGICVDYADYSVELTEQEARSEGVFGAYIPEEIPEGYTFEIARSSTGGLSVTWTRGMDDIMIFLSIAQEDHLETVDVEKTETYDVRLYEIPYGDTVPAEYREVFDDPLFAAEDLSLEVVSCRMKSMVDAGDTDTPRGNFSVLFPDGVVLRFNGRGTAEEIWNMFESVMR